MSDPHDPYDPSYDREKEFEAIRRMSTKELERHVITAKTGLMETMGRYELERRHQRYPNWIIISYLVIYLLTLAFSAIAAWPVLKTFLQGSDSFLHPAKADSDGI